MQQRCYLIGEDDLGRVDLGPLQRAEAVAFSHRQFGVELQKTPHIGIGRVAPELPEFIRAEHLAIEPDRAPLGFAHLLAIRGGQKRRGQPEDLRIYHPAGQVDPVDDIAPLIRAAHLKHAALAAVKLQEIIGLQDHVVEFEKAEALLAVQPRFDAFKRQHPVDREMPPDITQEFQIVQTIKPFGIVEHSGVGRTPAIAEIAAENALHPRDVGVDLVRRQKRALIGAEAGITHLGRAATHQGDRAVAGFLPPAQKHDVEQMAHMQRFGGRIISDIAGDGPFDQRIVKALQIGTIGQKATRDDLAQEIRFGLVGHRASVHAHALSGARL